MAQLCWWTGLASVSSVGQEPPRLGDERDDGPDLRGYGGEDLEFDGAGPRPRRLDAGFTERPGRLYRSAAREKFAAIVK
jgi:hypothetical protein